jgi:monofunctional biosynthetic peptidoglycan transglycosylase
MLSTFTLAVALMLGIGSMSTESYLQRAIERGAPLFNEGSPEACAAVYATALEGIAGSEGWGIEAEQRAKLGARLDIAAGIGDPAERAWAYRALIDTLLRGEQIQAPDNPEVSSLFDFTDASEVERWQIVVDGVMGGRSTGALSQKDDNLVFYGETSLRNNGGFSSIRARVPAGAMAGYDALRIRVKGDGRTYIIGASSQSGRGDSYWTRFETTPEEWVTVTVPVREMVRQYFGNPIRGQLQPAGVRGLEFYIYDKEEGPFRLEVAQIEAIQTRLGSE